jgi:uncharacterized protein
MGLGIGWRRVGSGGAVGQVPGHGQFSGLAIVNRTVDVYQLARTGACIEAQLPVGRMARLGSMLARGDAVVQGRLQGRIDELGRPAAVLELSGRLALTCDRCAAVLDWPLQSSAGFYFVEDEAALNAVPITAEGEEPLVGSVQFDWWELAEDQIILSLPISPRHAQCEAALRAAPEGSGSRNPFAALEVLKKGRTVVK